jgi:nucleoside phosphorylase
MADPVLDRITYRPEHEPLAPIPWPEGLAPEGTQYEQGSDDPLPSAEVVVVTWTAAEGEALADVLTPGLPSTTWRPYAHLWSTYEAQLTGRSPARDEHCMMYAASVRIGSVQVLALKSELHLATDGLSAPIVQLWKQIVGEAQPALVITTGTAGGIGEATQLGDVFAVTNAKFNCTQTFRSMPWAQQLFQGPQLAGGGQASSFSDLAAPNAAHLAPIADRPPLLTFGAESGGVETIDYFGFADTTDSDGIASNYPGARTEEMDDATLPPALADISNPPRWCSIRNASDPQVSSSIGDLEEQARWANRIYSSTATGRPSGRPSPPGPSSPT